MPEKINPFQLGCRAASCRLEDADGHLALGFLLGDALHHALAELRLKLDQRAANLVLLAEADYLEAFPN
ncbi:hypothetical protein [Streptosporangium sp. NPDC003464]